MLIDEGLELLTEAQCRMHLASGGIGRVGVTIAGLPVITPVNFAWIDDGIVFRTAPGSELRAAGTAGAVIAFEIDDYTDATCSGWSVLAIGRSAEVTDAGELRALAQLAPSPWADGDRSHFVRMQPEMLTGRQIVSH